MDLRLMKYFLMTAQELNITSAANLLHITQPTLSKELKHLEEDLGVALFERNGRSISLTEDGYYFRKRAKEIVELSDKLEAEFASKSETDIHGDIYIGAGEAMFLYTIADCIHRIREKYPHIVFHMFGGGGDLLVDRMNKGLLDFIVLIDSPEVKQYHAIPLPTQELRGLYMHKDMPWVQKGYIAPEDLKDIPLILPERPGLHHIIKSWSGYDYDQLNVIATYNLLYTVRPMAENKEGCVLGNPGALSAPNVVFVPLRPTYVDQFYVLYKKNTILKPSAKIFVEELNAMVRK